MGKDEALFLDELKNECDYRSTDDGVFTASDVARHMSAKFPDAGTAAQLEKALPAILDALGYVRCEDGWWTMGAV